jgi:hypothetical protein
MAAAIVIDPVTRAVVAVWLVDKAIKVVAVDLLSVVDATQIYKHMIWHNISANAREETY